MKKRLLFFLLFFVLGFVIFYKWASSPNLDEQAYSKIIHKPIANKPISDSIFSIITYNIGYLSGMTNNLAVDRNKELFINNSNKLKLHLNNLNVDILAIQEIDFDASRSYHINQMEELMTLGYPYAAQAINWDKKYLPFPYGLPSKNFGEIISGQSIISKQNIKEHERIVLKRVEDMPFYQKPFYLDRLAQIAKITIDGRDVIIINVHLEAFDKPTRMQQAEHVLKIYNKYKIDLPTILLGDFNSDPEKEDSAIQMFLKLKETGCAAFSSNYYKNTYNSIEPTVRIDHIFYNESYIDYVDGKVLTDFSDISDHLPVMMKFRLK